MSKEFTVGRSTIRLEGLGRPTGVEDEGDEDSRVEGMEDGDPKSILPSASLESRKKEREGKGERETSFRKHSRPRTTTLRSKELTNLVHFARRA